MLEQAMINGVWQSVVFLQPYSPDMLLVRCNAKLYRVPSKDYRTIMEPSGYALIRGVWCSVELCYVILGGDFIVMDGAGDRWLVPPDDYKPD